MSDPLALAQGLHRAQAHAPCPVYHREGGGGCNLSNESQPTDRAGWSLQLMRLALIIIYGLQRPPPLHHLLPQEHHSNTRTVPDTM